MRGAEIDGVVRGALDSCGYGHVFTHPAATAPGSAPWITTQASISSNVGRCSAGWTGSEAGAGLVPGEFGGIRKAGMVAITDRGAEVLTRFHWSIEELALQKCQWRWTFRHDRNGDNDYAV